MKNIKVLLSAIALMGSVVTVFAPHNGYEDGVVVERSRAIVIGGLKEGSIRFEVTGPRPAPDSAPPSEHRATLVVSEVLKGNFKTGALPIAIRPGLYPMVEGSSVSNTSSDRVFAEKGKRYPKGIIGIIDGDFMCSSGTVAEDARQPHIWFLRKGPALKEDQNLLWIDDLDDIQPVRLKSYFLAYLADDPEPAVWEHVRKQPDLAWRAETYFDHLDVQRIIKMPNSKDKVEKLLPYFRKFQSWKFKREARDALVECGSIASPFFIKLFQDSHDKAFQDARDDNLQDDIVKIWHDTQDREAVPILIKLLFDNDKYWATQKRKDRLLVNGTWNWDTPENKKRVKTFGEISSAVWALRFIGDLRAKEALGITLKRWENSAIGQRDIVPECRDALKAFKTTK